MDENGDQIDLLPFHDEGNVDEITTAFVVLRYAHLIAFLLHIPGLFKDLGQIDES